MLFKKFNMSRKIWLTCLHKVCSNWITIRKLLLKRYCNPAVILVFWFVLVFNIYLELNYCLRKYECKPLYVATYKPLYVNTLLRKPFSAWSMCERAERRGMWEFERVERCGEWELKKVEHHGQWGFERMERCSER